MNWLGVVVMVCDYLTVWQWRSHWGDKGGQSATPDSENSPKIEKKRGKIRKNREKIKKNREKRGKIGKKRQKSGSFFHFAPPDR